MKNENMGINDSDYQLLPILSSQWSTVVRINFILRGLRDEISKNQTLIILFNLS